MIERIRDFLGRVAGQGFSENKEERNHQTLVAACALLIEMANADGKFSEAEKVRIMDILKHEYQLSDDLADSLVEVANHELEDSIDLWRFTNLVNEHFTTEQKLQVIEMVWRVAYTDGKLDQHEDYLAHKLATLLRLTHQELIQAKLRVISPS